MRQGGEDEVDFVERTGIELLDRTTPDKRLPDAGALAEPLPGPAVAEQLHGRELRMRGEEPQQFAADIARGSKDGRPNHEERPYRHICIIMQVNA